MELEHNYILFAESVIRDESKKLSIINIFDNIQVLQIPAFHSKIFIVFNLKVISKVKKTYHLNIFITKPDGALLVEAPIDIKVDPSEGKSTQIVTDMGGLPIEQLGDYKFELGFDKDKIISTRSLPVTKMPVK